MRKSSLGGLLCLVGLAGCASSSPHPITDAQRAPTDANVLSQGDVIEVRVYREKDLSGTFRVAPDGKITFPLLGELKIEGQSPTQLASLLSSKLQNGYLKRAEVSVYVREQAARKVHVLGQVNKAGSFRFRSGMSIIEAIVSAGGFTPEAAPNRVVITRGAAKHVVKADEIRQGEAPNFALRAGDIVFVPEYLM